MSVFTKSITFVKGLSLPAKIVSVVIIVSAIGGGTTAIVLLSQNKPATEPEPTVVSSEPKKEETKKEEKKAEEKKEESQSKADDPTKLEQDTQETVAEAPKAETEVETKAEEPKTEPIKTEPVKTEETPTKTEEITEPTKAEEAPTTPTADYNLNDQYVYADYSVTFLDCENFEEANFTKRYFSIAKYAGIGNEADRLNMSKAAQDAQKYGYCLGGIGARIMSWAEVVAAGKALDETVCAKYGLSCARW